MATPFTIASDLDLGPRMEAWQAAGDADISISAGDPPERLEDATQAGVAIDVVPGKVLIRIPGGTRFLVEGGTRITYCRGDAGDRKLRLFLFGTAWAALCYQRDLLPLHASAVLVDGRVHAFTGVSGAGKSTLAAALAAREYPLFADDLLVLDPASEGGLSCHAGHKRLKLWEDALALTGSEAQEAVRDEEGFAKFYAAVPSEAQLDTAPLASLSILRNDAPAHGEIVPARSGVSGSAALSMLGMNIYRPLLGAAIWPRPKLFAVLARLAGAIDVGTFNRSLKRENFGAGIDAFEAWLRNGSGG